MEQATVGWQVYSWKQFRKISNASVINQEIIPKDI